jgi:hypothetical protein
VLVGSLFGVGQRFNGVLPRPRGDAVVAACQIRFGKATFEKIARQVLAS